MRILTLGLVIPLLPSYGDALDAALPAVPPGFAPLVGSRNYHNWVHKQSEVEMFGLLSFRFQAVGVANGQDLELRCILVLLKSERAISVKS